MSAFSMTPTQFRFFALTWTAAGAPVDPATLVGPLAPAFASSNPAAVGVGMMKADGTPGDAADPGRMAVIGQGQGSDGTASVTVRVTNADASFFEQQLDMTTAAVIPPVANVDGGSIDLEAPLEKAAVVAARRR